MRAEWVQSFVVQGIERFILVGLVVTVASWRRCAGWQEERTEYQGPEEHERRLAMRVVLSWDRRPWLGPAWARLRKWVGPRETEASV